MTQPIVKIAKTTPLEGEHQKICHPPTHSRIYHRVHANEPRAASARRRPNFRGEHLSDRRPGRPDFRAVQRHPGARSAVCVHSHPRVHAARAWLIDQVEHMDLPSHTTRPPTRSTIGTANCHSGAPFPSFRIARLGAALSSHRGFTPPKAISPAPSLVLRRVLAHLMLS